jgi:hypothetical protein
MKYFIVSMCELFAWLVNKWFVPCFNKLSQYFTGRTEEQNKKYQL